MAQQHNSGDTKILAGHKARKRMTSQKRLVLEFLQSTRSHPSAESVYLHVREKLPSTTLATVYRNLHSLCEEGRAQMLEIDGTYRFDGDAGMHIHLSCRVCGRIEDCCKKSVADGMKNACSEKGFCLEQAAIAVKGVCQDCIAGKRCSTGPGEQKKRVIRHISRI